MRRRHIFFVALRWLTLTLVGWSLYASVRALWTIIRLGVPFYDWQWYVVFILLLVGLAVRLVLRFPRPRLTLCVFAGLLIWAVVGYNGFGRVLRLYPARVSSPPISFWASPSIAQAPEAVLNDLRAAGGQLYLAVGRLEGERGQSTIAGLQRLAEHGIDVYLRAPASNYVSVPVHDEWITNVKHVAAVVKREGLTNVRGIIGDAESPKETPFDYFGADRGEFFEAMRDLDDLNRWMRENYPDLSLGVTADWALYLDGIDGDPDLSIVNRCPVDPPGGWGFINSMTYSSFHPPSWRAYFVYLVERALARRYPDDQPSHLIGLIAGGLPWEPLLDFDDLVRDARLSRALGVPEIVVFRLPQALEVHGDDFVRRFTAAVNDVPPDLVVEVPFSRPTSVYFYGVVAGDALLDALSWRGLILIAWMVLSGVLVYRSAQGGANSASRERGQALK